MPDQRISCVAIHKIDSGAGFGDALFVTEILANVLAVRRLSMTGVHPKGSGQATGDVERLSELIPIVKEFVEL